MAQGARQSSLFSAEDFSVVYESFSEANFQAYDYETIRNAMVDYINRNYPENYNDWINSSEFVSLIELMAFLGHNLAFRSDLASRENFLSTAERRESALRIAEFLGYTPTRNVVASGYLKIDSIFTTENIFDAAGNSLANTTVQFDDTTDPNSSQNFLAIMNSIFQTSSQFGSPFSQFTSGGVTNSIYRTNSVNNIAVRNFENNINNRTATFSFHSVSANTTTNTLTEKTPDPYAVVDLLYKDDNSGITSANTGFFVGFKQGTLEYKDFNIVEGLPNMVLDINVDNVANAQLWVQTINEVGQVQQNWTRVDRQFGASTIFNATSNNIRNIYSVASRENDQVSIVFGDGNFGNVPRGIIRIWYRVGLNQNYTLDPNNFRDTTLVFDYVGNDANTHTATITCSLKSTVTNASERESLESIKVNAPRYFASQDRMITAEDYSIFPITVSENVAKIKSVNRVHSGHSRFRDIYDPTATYNDAIQYADDGYLYENNVTNRSLITLPNTLTSEQIYKKYILPLLSNEELKNFYYNRQGYSSTGYSATTDFDDTTANITVVNSTTNDESNVFRWNQISKGASSSSGYFTLNNGSGNYIQRVGLTQTNSLRKASLNSLVEFISSPYKMGYIETITLVNGGSGYTSTPTVTIIGAGSNATASATVVAGEVTALTITNSGNDYNVNTVVAISGGGGSNASAKVTVGFAETKFVKIDRVYKDGIGDDDSSGSPTGLDNAGKGAIVLSGIVNSASRVRRIVTPFQMDFDATIKTAVLNKISSKVSFGLRYNSTSQSWLVIDSANLPANTIANNSVASWSRLYEADNAQTGRDNSWLIRMNYSSTQWEVLARRTQLIFGSTAKLKFGNLNFNQTFSSETQKPLRDTIKVLSINKLTDDDPTPLGTDYIFNTFGYITYKDGYTDPYKVRVALSNPNNNDYPTNPESFNNILRDQTIKLGTKTVDGFDYTVYDSAGTTTVNGKANLHTQYNRISDIDNVIDPAVTNIVDTYVLLKSYDSDFRIWANYDGRVETKPNAPTINELTNIFDSLQSKKAISDQVIYRPVKYKILFGDLANSEMQAKFNVTKTSNSSMSDTEIKQNVIRLITDYFNVDNWDFGEDFYFTELAAYIHNNMIGEISQITIQPVGNTDNTTDLFEITSNSDELFLPIVKTSNITVTNTVTKNSTTIGETSSGTIASTGSGTSGGGGSGGGYY